MTLNANSITLLDACAKAIVHDRPLSIDLRPLGDLSEFSHKDVARYLTDAVELISRNSYTVRIADNALFDAVGEHVGLPLVRCPADTPEGMVTELSDEMLLVRLESQDDGLQVNAAQASPESVARSRAETAKMISENRELGRAVRESILDIDAVLEAFWSMVEKYENDDPWLPVPRSDNPTIITIIQTCHRFNVPVAQFFQDALDE